MRHLNDGTLTADDVDLLREWLDEITAQNDLSVARVNKIAFHMVAWRRFIGPFRANTISDLNTGIRTLKTAAIAPSTVQANGDCPSVRFQG